MTPAQPLLQDSRFDLRDFQNRWRRARRSALETVLDDKSGDGAEGEDEESLVRRVPSERRDELLKAIFDRSRLLGRGLARHLGLTLDRDDFEALLETSGVRCFAGEWVRRGNARVLRRAGFEAPTRDALVCSYWREAADGLVMGAGEDERYARHGSVLHGDPSCEDVLFLEERESRADALGPIPSRLAPGLATIQNLFRSVYRLEVLFPGYAEGTLYYLIEGGTGASCGPGAKLIELTLTKKLEALEPGLRLRDASPKAVIGGPE